MSFIGSIIAQSNIGGGLNKNIAQRDNNNQQFVMAKKAQLAAQKSIVVALNNIPSAPTNNTVIANGRNAQLSGYTNQSSGQQIIQTPKFNALSVYNTSATSLSASGGQVNFKAPTLSFNATNATSNLFQTSYNSLDFQSSPRYLSLSAYQSNALYFDIKGGSFNLQA